MSDYFLSVLTLWKGDSRIYLLQGLVFGLLFTPKAGILVLESNN